MGSVGSAVSGHGRLGADSVRRLGVAGFAALVVLACGGGSATPRMTGTTGGTSSTSGGVTGTGGSGPASGGSEMAATGGLPTTTGGTGEITGGTAATTGGVSASTGGNANGGTTSTGGTGTATGGAGGTAGAAACQMAKVSFEPKIPTVYVMVDRSGSMFDCISTTNQVEPSCATKEDTPWVKLKDATLMVIESLQADVRFGFASFTGTNPSSGGMCPMIDQVAPDFNNYTAIKTLYDGLAFQPNTNEVGKKFETPARQSLDTIGAKLLADTSPGDKYILFVTDGQPDYCDDANSLCAPDSVIAGLQILKSQGITTIVMGLKSALNDLAPGILQGFADAGAGLSTMAPLKENSDTFAFYDQCNGVAGWHADLLTSGKTAERGVTLGTYSATSGGAKLYAPSAADQTMIVTQLRAALSGVKSCAFDLSNVNGQSIKVDLNELDKATVSIMGSMVALDMTDGWSMASPTQLVLNGKACETWRMPDIKDIAFNFPCKTIIFE